MKHRRQFKGLFVVLLLSSAMAFLWNTYEVQLRKGQAPPASTQILKNMELHGVPQLELTDLQGKKYSLSQWKGKVVIINFWASWCAPCVEEFPSLIQLIQHFKGDIILLAISADTELEDLSLFIKAFQVNDPSFLVFWDKERKIAPQFGTETLPESYILNTKGRLIKKVVGIDNWSSPGALLYFKDLLNQSH